MFAEQVEDDAHVLLVFLEIEAKDQYDIEECDDKLTDMSAEHRVHEALKRSRRIAEAERHHSEVIMPLLCFECRFFFVLLAHANLMVDSMEIYLGKVGCTSQFIEQFIDCYILSLRWFSLKRKG